MTEKVDYQDIVYQLCRASDHAAGRSAQKGDGITVGELVGEINRQLGARREMREALYEAQRDIQEWRQLAKYQCEMMDNNLGWCPTQAGIEKSGKVLETIGAALARKP